MRFYRLYISPYRFNRFPQFSLCNTQCFSPIIQLPTFIYIDFCTVNRLTNFQIVRHKGAFLLSDATYSRN